MTSIPINPTEALVYISNLLSPIAHFAYLVGSFGTERFNDRSDIDIAVHFKTPPSFDDKSKLIRSLENHFNRDVDLISLNDIDCIFAYQVLDKGREIFVNEPTTLLLWKIKHMSMYPDFKASRRIIEENLLNRKKL